jgi:hypothetical protein
MAVELQSDLHLNSENQFFVDTDGNNSLDQLKSAKFAWLANGVEQSTFAPNETSSNHNFFNMKGFGSTYVTGKRITIAMTGLHIASDEAQKYIASKFLEVGDDLQTLFVWKGVDGQLLAAVVTLQNIVPTGGQAAAFETFSLTIAFNGKPKKIKPADVTLPGVEYVGDDAEETPTTPAPTGTGSGSGDTH